MVLVVVADVVCDNVERAVVRVRLLVGAVPEKVLRDEVCRARVQGARKEGREEEVEQRAHACELVERKVERQLRSDVGDVPACEALGADEARAEGVKEDLERGEEDLSEDGIEAEELEAGRQIRVDAVLAEKLVMLDVIPLGESASARTQKSEREDYDPL